MKLLLKFLPKNAAIVGALLLVIAVLLMLKMKNLKNYIFVGLGALVLGFASGWLLHKQPECLPVTKEVVNEVKYIDTCLATIIRDTFYVTQPVIKKGRKHIRTSKPKIDKVEVKDSTYHKTFSKSYNEGLLRSDISFVVSSKSPDVNIENFQYGFEIDTLMAKEMYRETQTIVLQPTVTETTKYLPTESTARFLKAVAGISQTDKLFYQVGATMEFKPLEITVLKNIKSQGGSVQIAVPLLKIKK